eukprot:TRINITY_DN776_c0_g1_i1.p1 TRINITY_DN776_c0_g1~~TRINITY_DN776_c0_g1_i1.p1  ORF type:complete len:185 (+),score=64.11 TRINITY_DN776_c0_g1_i1:378-932(+)
MAVCWLLVIILLTWNQVHLLSDPTHSYANDIGGYIFLAIVAIALVAVYAIWVSYLVFRAFVEAKGSVFLGPRIRFLGCVTIIVMMTFIVIVVVTFLAPPAIENNASVFLTSISLADIYVWTLVVVFLPIKDAIRFQETKGKGGVVNPTEGSEFPDEKFEEGGGGGGGKKIKVELSDLSTAPKKD